MKGLESDLGLGGAERGDGHALRRMNGTVGISALTSRG
jgi:hypothetical protein